MASSWRRPASGSRPSPISRAFPFTPVQPWKAARLQLLRWPPCHSCHCCYEIQQRGRALSLRANRLRIRVGRRPPSPNHSEEAESGRTVPLPLPFALSTYLRLRLRLRVHPALSARRPVATSQRHRPSRSPGGVGQHAGMSSTPARLARQYISTPVRQHGQLQPAVIFRPSIHAGHLISETQLLPGTVALVLRIALQ